jgi:hypothetical protein
MERRKELFIGGEGLDAYVELQSILFAPGA